MAITTNDAIKSLLKVWYKDGVENLMFRNSPVVKKITKTKVEGKSQAFSAMYGRGGAVSSNFLKAKANAANTSRNAEFMVTPGQLFSVYSMNAKEVQASLSKKGAYMRVAGNKMFAASESLRKSVAAALYGRGYGELCLWRTTTAITTDEQTFDMPADAIMKIDVGSLLDVKASISATTVKATLTVTAINGEKVSATSDKQVSSMAATDVLCISGSMDDAGKPIMPMGLDGWLPIVHGRSTGAWTSYIETPFFDVVRSTAADRLAGAFEKGVSGDKKVQTLQKLLKKVRRQGSQADMIIINDDDWLDIAQEIETSNTYFTQTSTTDKKKASTGISEMTAAFSTNFVENIWDDPYCPKGKFYIIDSSALEFWSYTNTDKLDDGVAGNNAGKQDPMTMDGSGNEHTPQGLIIDDYLTVQDGEPTLDGPATEVTLNLFGSFVVLNPSVCGVGMFYSANMDKVIGY